MFRFLLETACQMSLSGTAVRGRGQGAGGQGGRGRGQQNVGLMRQSPGVREGGSFREEYNARMRN